MNINFIKSFGVTDSVKSLFVENAKVLITLRQQLLTMEALGDNVSDNYSKVKADYTLAHNLTNELAAILIGKAK